MTHSPTPGVGDHCSRTLDHCSLDQPLFWSTSVMFDSTFLTVLFLHITLGGEVANTDRQRQTSCLITKIENNRLLKEKKMALTNRRQLSLFTPKSHFTCEQPLQLLKSGTHFHQTSVTSTIPLFKFTLKTNLFKLNTVFVSLRFYFLF